TVPEGGEVGGRDLGGDQLALGGAQGADRGVPLGVVADVPALGAGEPRVDVGHGAAAGVPLRRDGPQHLSRGGVAEGGAPFPAGVRVVVDGDDLETRAGGVDVADVHRVAVTQPGRVQAGAVVVDGRGPVDDLVLLVAVDVRDGQVVVPLTGVSLVAGVIRVEE